MFSDNSVLRDAWAFIGPGQRTDYKPVDDADDKMKWHAAGIGLTILAYTLHLIMFGVYYHGGDLYNGRKPWPNEFMWMNVMDTDEPDLLRQSGFYLDNIWVMITSSAFAMVSAILCLTGYTLQDRHITTPNTVARILANVFADTMLFMVVLGVLLQTNIWTRAAMVGWYMHYQVVQFTNAHAESKDESRLFVKFMSVFSMLLFAAVYMSHIIVQLHHDGPDFHGTAIAVPWLFLALEAVKFIGAEADIEMGTTFLANALRLLCYWLAIFPLATPANILLIPVTAPENP